MFKVHKLSDYNAISVLVHLYFGENLWEFFWQFIRWMQELFPVVALLSEKLLHPSGIGEIIVKI